MITILMSCLALNTNQRERLEERAAQREAALNVLNERSGRWLVSVLGGRNDIAWLVERLTEMSKDPLVIAGFRSGTGRRIREYPIDRAAWRAVAPDVQTGTNPDGSPIMGRPPIGSFRQTNTWLGHAPHDEQEEEPE